MFDPWSFLDLDPENAAEKDVRSAYARLLKKYRPDQDPAGFQRLRQAYEAALEEARARDEGSELEDDAVAPGLLWRIEQPNEQAPELQAESTPSWEPLGAEFDSNFASEKVEWPEPVCEAIAALAQAIEKGSDKKARRLFRQSWRVFRQARLSVQDRARAWLEATQGATSRLVRIVCIEALIEQWKGGEWKFTFTLVDHGGDLAQISVFKQLAWCLAKHRSTILQFEAAVVAVHMAELVAIDIPATARVLINAAYLHLAPHERSHGFPYAESRETTGIFLAQIPWWPRQFWISAFRDESVPVNWNKWRNRYRLRKLSGVMPGS